MDETDWHPAKECDVPKLDVGETWGCSCGRQWARQEGHRGNSYYEIVTETYLSDEYTTEVLEAKESGRSTFYLNSELLHNSIDTDNLDEDVGIQIHQDGQMIAVVAGTMNGGTGEGTELRSYVKIDPEGARALADALYVAADNSEREYEYTTPDHGPETDDSILGRLLS